MATSLLGVLGGALLLALTVWAWRGRSRAARWWVGGWWGRETMLGIVPGIGVIAFCVGWLTASRQISEELFGGVALLIALPVLLAFVLEIAGLIGALPRWWAPRWYRQLSEEEIRVGSYDPFDAAMFALSARPDVISAKEISAKYRGRTPVGSWSGGWVFDPDTNERPHGLARKGAVDGSITVYDNGVVFAASRAEDALRGEGTVLTININDVIGTRVVPARAGADGKPRKGVLYRSLFSRLLISTVNGEYIFEFHWPRAEQVAEQLIPLIPQRR